MLATLLSRLRRVSSRAMAAVRTRVSRWTKPGPPALAGGLVADLARSRRDLLLENALLRQQLIVLNRANKRPALTPIDRSLLVLLASRLRSWAAALIIVQPETVLRWHRQGCRLLWRHRSRTAPAEPKVPAETVALIKEMATANRLWGAERIRGELLKLGIRVSKRTVQRYLRQGRPPRPSGQSWSTFLRSHACQTWACDFLQVSDLFFRPLFAFVIVELGSRRVVHIGVTRQPTDAWVAQQLREATPFAERPRFLIRDNDGKYGARFERVATASGIAVLRSPPRAPRANAICERFLGSVRRECLDHLLILTECQLRRALRQYAAYFNGARPHQGLGQRVPAPPGSAGPPPSAWGGIIAVPVLGGLHHAYRRAA